VPDPGEPGAKACVRGQSGRAQGDSGRAAEYLAGNGLSADWLPSAVATRLPEMRAAIDDLQKASQAAVNLGHAFRKDLVTPALTSALPYDPDADNA
jgi:hypothetical protein